MPITDDQLDLLINQAIDEELKDKRSTRTSPVPALASFTRDALKETFDIPKYVKERRAPTFKELVSRGLAPAKAVGGAALTALSTGAGLITGVPSAILTDAIRKDKTRKGKLSKLEKFVRLSPAGLMGSLLLASDVPKSVKDEIEAVFGIGDRGPTEAGDIFREFGAPEPAAATLGLAAESPVLTARAGKTGIKLLTSKRALNAVQRAGARAYAALNGLHKFVFENLTRFPDAMYEHTVKNIEEVERKLSEARKFLKASRKLGIRQYQSTVAKMLDDVAETSEKTLRESADNLFENVRKTVNKHPRKLSPVEGRLLANDLRAALRENQSLKSVPILKDTRSTKLNRVEAYYLKPRINKEGEVTGFDIMKSVRTQTGVTPHTTSLKTPSASITRVDFPTKKKVIKFDDLPAEAKRKAEEVMKALQKRADSEEVKKGVKFFTVQRSVGGRNTITFENLVKTLENDPTSVTNADLMNAYMALRDKAVSNAVAERVTSILSEKIHPDLVHARNLWKRYNDILRDLQMFGKVERIQVGSKVRPSVTKLKNIPDVLFSKRGESPEKLRAFALRVASGDRQKAAQLLKDLQTRAVVDEAIDIGARPRLSALTIGGGFIGATTGLIGPFLPEPLRYSTVPITSLATLAALAGTVPSVSIKAVSLSKKGATGLGKGIEKLMTTPAGRAVLTMSDAATVKAVQQAVANTYGRKKKKEEPENIDIDTDAIVRDILGQ